MLCLTRKVNESIFVGSKIKIKIVKIHNGRVQLGIEAPQDVTVNREEVFLRIEGERGGNTADCP